MTKIVYPFVGTQVTAREYHDSQARKPVVANKPKTKISFKEEGTIPRSLTGVLPATSTLPGTTTTTTTTTTVLPGTTTATTTSHGHGHARRGHNNRTLLSTERRDPNLNEIIITQRHGPEVSPLMEAIATFAHGELPYNMQLEAIINSSIGSITAERKLNEAKMNERGKKVSRDMENLLQSILLFLRERNGDEKLQKLFLDAKMAGMGTYKATSGVKASDLKSKVGVSQDVKKQSRDTLQLTKNLAVEIINSKDFRSLLMDTIRVFKEVFATNLGPKGQALKGDLRNIANNFEQGEGLKTLGLQMKEALRPPKVTASQTALPYTATTGTPNTVNVALNPQQKELLARKLRRLLARYGENEKFRTSAMTIFKIVKDFYRQGQSALKSDQASGVKQGIKSNSNMGLVWTDLKDIIERFTDGRKLDRLVDNMKDLFQAARNDTIAKQWFKDFKRMAVDAFNHPQTIEDDVKLQETMNLIDRGRIVFSSDRYNSHLKAVLRESKKLLKRMKRDPTRVALANASSALTRDLFYHNNSPSFFAVTESLGQMKYVLMPILSQQLERIELPRVEGYTQKADFLFENVVFSGKGIIPNNIQFDMDSSMNVNLRNEGTNYARGNFRVIVRNVNLSLNSIAYQVRTKSFPRINDVGLVDVDLGRGGVSIMLEMSSDVSSGDKFQLYCVRAACGIDTLNVNMRQGHHKFLGKMGLALFKNRIKATLERAIAENLVGSGVTLSTSINKMIAVSKEKAKIRSQQRREKLEALKAKRALKQKEKKKSLKKKKERKASLKGKERVVSTSAYPVSTAATTMTSVTGSTIEPFTTPIAYTTGPVPVSAPVSYSTTAVQQPAIYNPPIIATEKVMPIGEKIAPTQMPVTSAHNPYVTESH